ncbi:MAG: hypothetical protein HBSAPP03_20930 [Phycisphaerae bacterium]|nr:MAG: hypothetical protein HBSAPP03_20930 [Phycisphaerae bacterium]
MGAPSSQITIQTSLLDRAKASDPDAIATMFRQFLSEGEQVVEVEYLGVRGIWVFGEHCWACLTDRRVACLRVGKASEVFYQDALIEGINSGAVYQPSLMPLYIGIGVLILAALATFGVTLLLIPLAIFWFHKHTKCGVAFFVREGLTVFFFANRKRLTLANRLYRRVILVREARVKVLSMQMQVASS